MLRWTTFATPGAILGHSVRNLIERLDPQAAEKAVKAVHYAHGARRVSALDELLDDARELDLNYIPTRYPNGLDAWTPAAGFGTPQAARAIAGASAILTAARRHLRDL